MDASPASRRLERLRVVMAVIEEPHAFVDVLAAAATRDEALANLSHRYECDDEVAQYLLDMRSEFLTPYRGRDVADDVESLRKHVEDG